MRQQTRIIVNPAARRPPSRAALLVAVAQLREQGWLVDICLTTRSGDAMRLAAEAATRGYDSVVACGGDGTVNEVLNGVAGTATALAVLPAGTVNVWAREAGLPRRPSRALGLLMAGERVRLDVGRADERAFLLMASAGLDSAVVARVRGPLKRRLGQLAYGAAAPLELRRFAAARAELRVDGERIETSMLGIVAGNTRLYGGLIEATSAARADDGLLDLCLYQGERPTRLLSLLLLTALRRHRVAEGVLYRKARRIELRTEFPLAVQVDGDLAGTTPVVFSVEPRAVTVVVPRGLQTPLWRSPGGLDSRDAMTRE